MDSSLQEFSRRAEEAEQLLKQLTTRVETLEKGNGNLSADKLKSERDEALDLVKKLQAENARLKAQLGSASGAGISAVVHPTSSHKFSKRIPIKELISKDSPFIDSTITAAGWIKTVRLQGGGRFCFIEVNDGSSFTNLQVILDQSQPGFDVINGPTCGTGASVLVIGKLVKSTGSKQPTELKADSAELLGECVPGDYPLAKGFHPLEFLRTVAHLRPRSNTFGAMSRVRNSCALATHLFFQQNGFNYVHTPIITASDCEGAGEMFQVTTLLKNVQTPQQIPVTQDGKLDYSKDFFEKPAFLTVSGQLNGEMYATALSRIYTFGPTFRAEPSLTSRHMAEFWMIEPEMAFMDLSDCMDYAEAYLKFVIQYVLKYNEDDMKFFDQFIEKGLLKRLKEVLAQPFKRVTYTEAVDILLKSGKEFKVPVSWGIDLQSEHERYITEEVFKQPVILIDYPRDIKAFYMRLNEDGKTVSAMDVLVPKIGEIIGGSQREERLDVLEKRIAELKMDKAAYKHYLDLRKFGSVVHSGFGLGFERLIMFITGLENIRDVIPFPRWLGHAEF